MPEEAIVAAPDSEPVNRSREADLFRKPVSPLRDDALKDCADQRVAWRRCQAAKNKAPRRDLHAAEPPTA
jgi:hypothetical protein